MKEQASSECYIARCKKCKFNTSQISCQSTRPRAWLERQTFTAVTAFDMKAKGGDSLTVPIIASLNRPFLKVRPLIMSRPELLKRLRPTSTVRVRSIARGDRRLGRSHKRNSKKREQLCHVITLICRIYGVPLNPEPASPVAARGSQGDHRPQPRVGVLRLHGPPGVPV